MPRPSTAPPTEERVALLARMKKFGIRKTVLAEYLGVTPTAVSSGLMNRGQIGRTTFDYWRAVVDELVELQSLPRCPEPSCGTPMPVGTDIAGPHEHPHGGFCGGVGQPVVYAEIATAAERGRLARTLARQKYHEAALREAALAADQRPI